MERKKIENFKQYVQNQKILKENVEIEVDWWEQCQIEVMQELERICSGVLSMDVISEYIKNKFLILGRPYSERSDNLIIMHIKDLIFQYHGDSLCNGISAINDNEEIHSKGIVIEQLAKEIFDKLADKELEIDTIKTKLSDEEPMEPIIVSAEVDYPNENCEDLPIEYESRKVKGFADYLTLKEKINSK